ncbi:glycoside hydrolase superfamily [Amylocystis lapponica]|nr:glycoside hydrolase superfamily [Amylocystis lapponica]
MSTQTRVQKLSNGWYWKERDAQRAVVDEIDGASWAAASSFPSEIHTELLKVGKIPDPFLGFNEHKVQWVGEREWLYYSQFAFQKVGENEVAELVFEGLDTICDVYLNGHNILSADNMFRTYVVPVSPASLKPAANTLLLHFKSTKLIAKELEEQHGRVRAGSVNLGDPSRVYIRKAQYGWRWDWGPEIMSVGPYRDISLVAYTARLASVHTRAHVSPAPALSPSLKVDLALSGNAAAAKAARIALIDTSGQVLKEQEVLLSLNDDATAGVEFNNVVDWPLGDAVKPWWPLGYGRQNLYNVQVTLLGKDDVVLDTQSKRVGFRDVKLVQEPLKEADRYGRGTTFLFEINGVRMFMGGSNWIPAHNSLTEVTAERYREWITILRDGNQNMVRLWGGGVYEPDVFYDTCDANVKAEAEDNVRRLRHHPSMAVFCGNNEDYQQVLQWGDITDLPARLIYEDTLPNVVAALTDPPIPYHRGSPYGGKDWDTADPTVGDIHQWDVWAGKERPWQEYESRGGRFVSEFGLPSMPDIRTVDYWLDGNTKDRWAQSPSMQQHNKAGSHERRFAIVMNENFRLTSDLETHIYNTQIMQSEGASLAYRSWRREWRGPGKQFTAGALIWQTNDCWPVTSWAIVDYFLRKKPAYFTIARELAPVTVGILRKVTKNRENDRPIQFYEYGAFRSVSAHVEIWATNSALRTRTAILVLQSIDLLSDWTHEESSEVVLLPNQTTELLSIPCPSPPADASGDQTFPTSSHVVLAARLLDTGSGEVLARYADWPQPLRLAGCPDPGLRISVDGEKITVEAARPAKGLVLTVDDNSPEEDVKWSDNALDVVPGDKQVVLAQGLGERALKVAYLGHERATRV